MPKGKSLSLKEITKVSNELAEIGTSAPRAAAAAASRLQGDSTFFEPIAEGTEAADASQHSQDAEKKDTIKAAQSDETTEQGKQGGRRLRPSMSL